MYHPSAPPPGGNYDKEEFEYIELQNIGTAPIILTGVKFTQGVTFTFPEMTLDAGAYTLVVEDAAAFASRYPDVTTVAGQYSGKLNNAGETITLIDANGNTILSFAYDDDWYPTTDGSGYSLVIVDATAAADTWGLQSSWRVSTNKYGSPGEADPIPGVIVSPTSGLTTTEAGGTAEFTVLLSVQPLDNVTIPIASTNTSEGIVNTASLTFTPDNWDQPQTVTIIGVVDSLADGDMSYAITLGQTVSTDSRYNGLDPADVSVTNVDKTRVWDGGGGDNNWTTAANWVGDVAPAAGDNLLFPAGAAQLDNINDYPSSIVFGTITVSGSGYHFQGNSHQASTFEVQSNTSVEVNAISTDTLTIGAGSVLTISAISGGPLATLSDQITLIETSPAVSLQTSSDTETAQPAATEAVSTSTSASDNIETVAAQSISSDAVVAETNAALIETPTAAPVMDKIETTSAATITEKIESTPAAPVTEAIDTQAETRITASGNLAEASASANVVSNAVTETIALPVTAVANVPAPVLISQSIPLRQIETVRESVIPQSPIYFTFTSTALRGLAEIQLDYPLLAEKQINNAKSLIFASLYDELPSRAAKSKNT